MSCRVLGLCGIGVPNPLLKSSNAACQSHYGMRNAYLRHREVHYCPDQLMVGEGDHIVDAIIVETENTDSIRSVITHPARESYTSSVVP